MFGASGGARVRGPIDGLPWDQSAKNRVSGDLCPPRLFQSFFVGLDGGWRRGGPALLRSKHTHTVSGQRALRAPRQTRGGPVRTTLQVLSLHGHSVRRIIGHAILPAQTHGLHEQTGSQHVLPSED